MIIIGAKGFAKEVLEVLRHLGQIENIAFYDDINTDLPNKLYNNFPILKSKKEVLSFFDLVKDKRFTIGIGSPILRKKIYNKFISWGGILASTVSPNSIIGAYDVTLGDGVNILSGVNISNGVKIGKACLIYYNAVITHDCKIGDFVDISPSVNLLGRCKIGSYCHIGANATILPDVEIGENVVVGAGSVVNNNIPSNSMVVGVPGKIIRTLKPIHF